MKDALTSAMTPINEMTEREAYVMNAVMEEIMKMADENRRVLDEQRIRK